MCGIAGLISLGADIDGGARRVTAMCDAIGHRGPDGGGTVAHPEAWLGMRRLAIVDLAHGHQPMQSDDGQVQLVYNGEIYNAPALRASLEKKGVKFKTRSDTEVILRLYEANPDRVEEELVGMWAFCIHDRARRKIVLSRDRFGIKPLFVADAGKAVAFASELRSFAPVRDLPGMGALFALDPAAAHALLSWAYVPELGTIYRGVRRLEPGTRLEIDLATGARTPRRYWELVPSPDAARVQSLDEACDLVESALRRAAREHLESDVPIAAFLSGGIDSSLVCAYAAEQSQSPIQAFSIGFREARFDESPYARETAERLGLKIEVTYLTEELARASLVDALIAYDEPFGDSSSLATFMLSQVVAKTHKVALSGDGGDEVFAGYKKHKIVSVRDTLAPVPAARALIGHALGMVPARIDRSRGWTELLRTVRKLSRGLEGDDAQAYVSLTQVAALARTAPLVRTVADPEHFEAEARTRFARMHGDQLRRTLASDLANPLPNDMLTKVDRASMAHHLEARVPFLDHRVAELGLGLPPAFTLGSQGKVVLRALHRRKFGERLANREKHGFGVPVEKWLGQSLARACDALFEQKRLERHALLSADALANGGWRRWQRTDPQVLWHAFALAAWCEAVHGDGPDALRGMLAPGGS